MSMMCSLLALSKGQMAAFRAEPSLAADFAEASSLEWAQRQIEARSQQIPPELRQRFEAAQRDMMARNPALRETRARLDASRPALDRLGPFEEVLDLDKDWHLLHFLFTGHADAASAPGDTLLTGVPLGRDLGYGPARLHDPADTRAFRDFLATLSVDRLAARMDFAQIVQAGIYPIFEVPDAANAQAWRDDVAKSFGWLKAYVERAANNDEGLLIWVH